NRNGDRRPCTGRVESALPRGRGMLRTVVKSKIHRARITRKDIDYMGSCTVDRALLEAADILPLERIQVLNLENAERFETYVLETTPGSRVVCLNGPAARLAGPGAR